MSQRADGYECNRAQDVEEKIWEVQEMCRPSPPISLRPSLDTVCGEERNIDSAWNFHTQRDNHNLHILIRSFLGILVDVLSRPARLPTLAGSRARGSP